MLRTFLDVAFHEGDSAKEISKRVKLPLSTVLRHLISLGVHSKNNMIGLGLIEDTHDGPDLRIKRYLIIQLTHPQR